MDGPQTRSLKRFISNVKEHEDGHVNEHNMIVMSPSKVITIRHGHNLPFVFQSKWKLGKGRPWDQYDIFKIYIYTIVY